MKWLYEIFRLFRTPKCAHHWELKESSNIDVTGDDEQSDSVIAKIRIRELHCKLCGEIKINQTRIPSNTW